MFPDEVDTPQDTPARTRFARYNIIIYIIDEWLHCLSIFLYIHLYMHNIAIFVLKWANYINDGHFMLHQRLVNVTGNW